MPAMNATDGVGTMSQIDLISSFVTVIRFFINSLYLLWCGEEETKENIVVVCVPGIICVCVCERERKIERDRSTSKGFFLLKQRTQTNQTYTESTKYKIRWLVMNLRI